MGGKGGGTNTVTNNTAPPAWLSSELQNIYGQASTAANAPLNQGGFNAGNLVAGFTPDQNSAFSTINNLQGAAQPYINNSQNLVNNSTQPIWSGVQQFSPNAVQQYMSPYTNNVLNSTIASENNQDAIQQAGVQGNAISSGAWGGDRSAVAQGIVAGQQALANNATNAGILNQGYTQGLQEFNTQQQAQLGANEAQNYLGMQGAATEAGLGNEALNTGLAGSSAQLQSGALQQQLAQEQLNVPYEQFLQQQAYPFQTASYLSSIANGTAGIAGGTGVTTSPAPSTLSQYGGLGLAGLGLVGSNLGSIGTTMSAADAAAYGDGAVAGDTLEGSGILGAIGNVFPSLIPAASGGAIPYRKGGIIPHYDDGGIIGGQSPSSLSLSPAQQTLQQNYNNMSVEQLRQIATRLPPASPQSQAIQKAIQQKTIMPNVGTQSQNGIMAGMAGGGMAKHLDNGGGSGYGSAADNDFSLRVPDLQFNAPDTSDLDRKAYTPVDDNGYGALLEAASQQGNSPTKETGIVPSSPAPQSGSPISTSTSVASSPPPTNTPDTTSKSLLGNMDPLSRALVYTGLGIASGTSPHAGVNIGAGALKGLSDEEAAEKLSQEAQEHKNNLSEEHLKDWQQGQYQQGQLNNQQQELALRQEQVNQGKFSPVKDAFGNIVGTMATSGPNAGKIMPITAIGGASGSSGNAAPDLSALNAPIKDIDGTPLTPQQQFQWKSAMKTDYPKDMIAQRSLLTSLVDQKSKVDDLAGQIPVASSGDLHTLADFADRNKLPIFSDPQRAAATVSANYDSLGNVLDNVRSTFQGTGRVLSKEFDTLKNELNANQSSSVEQKAAIVGKIQSRIDNIVQDEMQRQKDIRSGTAYLPGYVSPDEKRLSSMIAKTPNATVGNNNSPSSAPSVIKYDANGNRIQ